MAMVQVDLSEYDMLREAKNKAEEEVKELCLMRREKKEYLEAIRFNSSLEMVDIIV